MRDKARPIERARFLIGEAFAHDESRGWPPAQEPSGQRQRKAHGRRSVCWSSRGNLMQSVVRKPSAEGGIERASERKPPREPLARRAGFSLDLSDDALETRHPLRSAAWRHSVRVPQVRILFLFWT